MPAGRVQRGSADTNPEQAQKKLDDQRDYRPRKDCPPVDLVEQNGSRIFGRRSEGQIGMACVSSVDNSGIVVGHLVLAVTQAGC